MQSTESLSTKEDTSSVTTVVRDYVLQFYPLWFSYNQFQHSPHNRPFGPDRISAIFQSVVAVNDDTLYAITFLDLAVDPVILAVPETDVTYSVLTMDSYGDIFASGLPAQTPGTFALIGPGFSKTLPVGVTPIEMPLNISIMIFRADKFSASGVDQSREADLFRRSLKTQMLCDYENTPCSDGMAHQTAGGNTLILPEIDFSLSLKQIADDLVAINPIEFVKQLQIAVASPITPPFFPSEQALSSEMNSLLSNIDMHAIEVTTGVQTAHQAIISDYLTHTVPGTEWIHFTNIGAWEGNILDRAAVAEYFLYGNDISTAAYYHAFNDGTGSALDGSRGGYVLTFPAGHLPEAKRFWSVTAYTSDTIELIENAAGKYVVASYTPGLLTNSDGSVSIYMTTEPPTGVPISNWLPISSESFNVVLRIYGPEGRVASNGYVPPAIERLP